MTELKNFAIDKINQIHKRDEYRALENCQRQDKSTIVCNDQKLVSFSCNDSLGLSVNPEIIAQVDSLVKKFGIGAGASRHITGNHPLYAQLENAIARYHGYQSACIFGSGYHANLGVISCLMDRDDLIIADKLIHASMLDGARLSGAKLMRFAHNNFKQCADLLSKHRSNFKHCLILTEDVFSMDGDLGPLAELKSIANDYNAWLLSDRAHNLVDTPVEIDLLIGTFSKMFGSYGGYVCASEPVIDYIKNRARSLIYSTALPPTIIGSSLAAIEYIKNHPEILAIPLAKAKYFCKLLNLPEATSQIVSIIIGSSADAIDLADQLRKEGILVKAIRPPTVPATTARLRCSFSVAHEKQDIERLANLLKPKLVPSC